MLPVFLWVVLHAPQLLGVTRELIGLVKGLKGNQSRTALQGLLEAYQNYRKTGDSTDLKNIHGGLCVGKECQA